MLSSTEVVVGGVVVVGVVAVVAAVVVGTNNLHPKQRDLAEHCQCPHLILHLQQSRIAKKVLLMLEGGGVENCQFVYSLPSHPLLRNKRLHPTLRTSTEMLR